MSTPPNDNLRLAALTAANRVLQRHTSKARAAIQRSGVGGAPAHVKTNPAQATKLLQTCAGHLLRVCLITGETARHASRRLRLNPFAMQHLRKCPGEAVQKLREVNQPPRGCVRGGLCTCTSLQQRDHCRNWRQGDPSAFDIVGLPCDPESLDE